MFLDKLKISQKQCTKDVVQLSGVFLRDLAFRHKMFADKIIPVIISGDLQHLLDQRADPYDGIREHLIIFLQRLPQVPVDILIEHGLKCLRIAEGLRCVGTPYAKMHIPHILPFLFPNGKVQDIFIEGIQLGIEQKLVQIVKVPVHAGRRASQFRCHAAYADRPDSLLLNNPACQFHVIFSAQILKIGRS